MSLAAFQPKREPISVDPNGEPLFSVRALGLTDIASLIEVHLHDLDQLFSRIAVGGDVFAPDVGDSIIYTLVEDAPIIVAQIIALAADEPAAIEAAGKLPAPVQLDTLIKVFNLTFTDYGGPKKFIETVMMIYAKRATIVPNSPGAPSLAKKAPTPRPKKTRKS